MKQKISKIEYYKRRSLPYSECSKGQRIWAKNFVDGYTTSENCVNNGAKESVLFDYFHNGKKVLQSKSARWDKRAFYNGQREFLVSHKIIQKSD